MNELLIELSKQAPVLTLFSFILYKIVHVFLTHIKQEADRSREYFKEQSDFWAKVLDRNSDSLDRMNETIGCVQAAKKVRGFKE